MARTVKWWRVAAAAAAGAALALGPAGVAAAEEAVKARADVGSKIIDLPNAKGGAEPVGVITLQFADQDPVTSYCIDVKRRIADDAEYTETSWADSGRDAVALAKIQWLLTNGYPQVSAADLLEKADVELRDGVNADRVAYAATQAAIWSFSDSADFALGEHPDGRDPADLAAVRALYNWLRANAGTGTEPAPGLQITPSTLTGTAGSRLGPYTLVGGTATLTVTSGSIVDANGNPLTQLNSGGQFWLTSTTAATVTVKASGVGQVKAGRVFVRPGAQTVILAGTVRVPLNANASGTFTAGGLPITGAPVLGAVTAGLVLLGAGGALLLLRRRRVRFEV